jgi:hypothetical protein
MYRMEIVIFKIRDRTKQLKLLSFQILIILYYFKQFISTLPTESVTWWLAGQGPPYQVRFRQPCS